MERLPFLNGDLGTMSWFLIDEVKVRISDAIAWHLGQRAEPFLLTKTSVGSTSEIDLASSNRQSQIG